MAVMLKKSGNKTHTYLFFKDDNKFHDVMNSMLWGARNEFRVKCRLDLK